MYVSTLGLRSDQQTCECAAKLDVKAAFASLSAFSFPEMRTCEGIHAMITLKERQKKWMNMHRRFERVRKQKRLWHRKKRQAMTERERGGKGVSRTQKCSDGYKGKEKERKTERERGERQRERERERERDREREERENRQKDRQRECERV